MFSSLFNQKKIEQNQQTLQDNSMLGSSVNPNLRHDLSVLSHLDARATAVISAAEQESLRLKKEKIEEEQLLYGLLFDSDIFKIFSEITANISDLSKFLQKQQLGNFLGNPVLSETVLKILEKAFEFSKERGNSFISPEVILTAIFSFQNNAFILLQKEGILPEKIEEKLNKSSLTSVSKKSVLSKFGIDLTEAARIGKLDPIIGRDKETERLIHILLRRTKNNPIIIGQAGVGKTAVIEGLCQKIVKNEIPKELSNKKIFQLDVASLVAGASHRGEFEERLQNIIKEVQLAEGKIILFIDEIHLLIGAGDTEGALDASNIIKPYLARGQLQIIGTTTISEYRHYFEKDKAFARRFQPVLIDEPDEETAIEMIKVLRLNYEKFHSVIITDEAVISSVKLSKKYIGERFLPDKAVDLIDEAAAEVKITKDKGLRQDNEVKKNDIEKIISSWTGIPITRLNEDESQKLLNLEKLIHERFIDQEDAVRAVSESVRRGRIGLSSTNRPIASFIFLGPTGVGKTELAKTLAFLLFGKEEAMIRLDMSEYMEKHEVAKLIGAPPGYVGYEEGGQLTEAVRTKPYSIVLLDEVEKAHPDVFNILLQLLEDGRLTDNKGNTISFKNTIIIATSNIGSVLIQEKLSSGEGDLEQKIKELSKILEGELLKFFRPELINRFDEVVTFKPLTKEHMLEITRLGIEKTRKLLKEQGFELEISEQALAKLAEEGYEPAYGARPLRRLIQSSIENPISLLIIGKTFVQKDTILVDFDSQKEEFTFNKKQTVSSNEQNMSNLSNGSSVSHVSNAANASSVSSRDFFA